MKPVNAIPEVPRRRSFAAQECTSELLRLGGAPSAANSAVLQRPDASDSPMTLSRTPKQ